METDAPTFVSGGNGGNGGFGNGTDAWVLIILFALIFWGRGGWGNQGGQGGVGADLSGILTRGDLCQDMNFNDLQNGVRNVSDAVNLGFANLNSTICNQQYDTARMIDGLSTTVLQGFNATNVANLQSANALQSQIAQCCCDLRYENSQNNCSVLNAINNSTRDIVASQTAGTQRILDYLCNEKISALQSENAVLNGQISQAAQTNAIISALSPKTPIPAYPVFPTTSFAYPTGVAFGVNGLNNGCGCGCGCGTTIQ